MTFVHCGSDESVKRVSTRKDAQQYRDSACETYFNDLTKTISASIDSRPKNASRSADQRLLDVLYEKSHIDRMSALEPIELSNFTTLSVRILGLINSFWREFLRVSAELHDTDENQAIDATAMDRIALSQHSAKRTRYRFRTVNTNTLIDCKSGVIIDLLCSMKQPHDTNNAWQLFTPKLEKLMILTADKGYDRELLPHKLRSESVRPVVNYRDFGWRVVVNNVFLDETTYHQRSSIKATFFAL